MVNKRHWIRQGPLPSGGSRRPAGPPLAPSAWIGIDPGGDLLSAPHAQTNPTQKQKPAARILFINQYYWPDHASTAQHLTDLAESLSAQGYECHVLTSQSRYKPGAPGLVPTRNMKVSTFTVYQRPQWAAALPGLG